MLKIQPPTEAQLLVGQKVQLKEIIRTHPKYGNIISYEIADPLMEDKMNNCGNDVRIQLPSHSSPANYCMFRLSFIINKEGIITEALMG
jgi:hypothetical protein